MRVLCDQLASKPEAAYKLQATLEESVAAASDRHYWPRFRAAAQRASTDAHSAPPRTIAYALLDAVCGNAPELWRDYARSLLPAPHELSLPLCQPVTALAELQDPMLAALALKEQVGYVSTAPLSCFHEPAQSDRSDAFVAAAAADLRRHEGAGSGATAQGSDTGASAQPTVKHVASAAHPSAGEWATGCVVSRSLGNSHASRALAPFIDQANHSRQPNAKHARGRGAAGSRAEDSYVLVATRAIEPGDEITIDYTGGAGKPSAQMLWQYGFVEATNRHA